MVDGFERLRHHAIVGGNHDDDDVGHFGAARTHAGERLVTRRIEEDDLAAKGRRICLADTDLVRADVLRDAAGFAGRNIGFANRIEQRRLAVIDVAHDGDYRRTRDFELVGVFLGEEVFDGFVRHLVFEADDLGVGAELARDILHQFAVERLVHCDEDAAHEQRRDQILAADTRAFPRGP